MILKVRNCCKECCRNVPSQAALPSVASEIPSTLFEAIFADFFEESGYHYLVVGGWLSDWVEVYSLGVSSNQVGSAGLIAHLCKLFTSFEIPLDLSSYGAPEFIASATSNFFSCWGVNHRVSTAYNHQSNGGAVVAVKKAKGFLRSCIEPGETLNNDQFMTGMLQLCNTPDLQCKLSPAEV